MIQKLDTMLYDTPFSNSSWLLLTALDFWMTNRVLIPIIRYTGWSCIGFLSV